MDGSVEYSYSKETGAGVHHLPLHKILAEVAAVARDRDRANIATVTAQPVNSTSPPRRPRPVAPFSRGYASPHTSVLRSFRVRLQLHLRSCCAQLPKFVGAHEWSSSSSPSSPVYRASALPLRFCYIPLTPRFLFETHQSPTPFPPLNLSVESVQLCFPGPTRRLSWFLTSPAATSNHGQHASRLNTIPPGQFYHHRDTGQLCFHLDHFTIRGLLRRRNTPHRHSGTRFRAHRPTHAIHTEDIAPDVGERVNTLQVAGSPEVVHQTARGLRVYG